MLIAPKRLKLRTSHLTHVFPGTVRTWPQKFSQKGAWPGSRDPLNFWALTANSSKTVKATDFKFWHTCSQGQFGLDPQNIFPKGGVFNNLLGGDMHSHERLLVLTGDCSPEAQKQRITNRWSNEVRNIQCAAIKKTTLQKLQYLQNGVIFLYKIFSDYYGENLL